MARATQRLSADDDQGASDTKNHFGHGLLTIGAGRELVVAAPVGNITISATIRDNAGGASSLVKTGSGLVSLGGFSTYTGPTIINAGTLSILASGSIASASTITINSGAVLNIANARVFANTITGAGSVNLPAGANVSFSGNNSYAGGTAINGNTIDVLSTTALGSGTATATGNIVTYNFGVSGTVANDFVTGASNGNVFNVAGNSVTLSGRLSPLTAKSPSFTGSGTVALTGTSAWITTTVSGNGTRLVLRDAGTITGTDGIVGTMPGVYLTGTNNIFEFASSVDVSSFFRQTSGATIGAFGAIVMTGPGALTITDNTLEGGLTLSGGRLNLNDATALGASSGTFTITGGTIGNTFGGSIVISSTNPQAWNGNFSFVGPNSVNLGTGTVTLGGNRTVTITSSTLTVGGPIVDGGNGYGLTKAGPGTLALTGSSAYSGPTTVTEGTLTVGNTFALGSGTAMLNMNGGVLALASTSGTFTVSRSGLVTLAGGTITSGTFTNTGSALDARSGAISSVLAGTPGLTKTTSGTVALSGANTFTGGVTLSAGKLDLNAAGALGTGTFTITGGVLGNSAGSAVSTTTANAHAWNADFGFAGPTALTLGSGTVTLGATRTVTVTSSTLTVAIPITGSAGFGLTKAGPGTLVLSGSNGYTGPTTVNEGLLSVSGFVSGTGGTVVTGGTLSVSGTNAGTGPTTVSGGRLDLVTPVGLYAGGTASWTKENITVASGGVLSVRTGTFTTANVTTLLTSLGGLGGAVNNNGLRAGSAIGFDTTLATGTVGNVIADSTGPGGGAIGLVKYGTNTLLLTGSSTYTGTTSITAGTLQIGTTGRIAGPIANAAALVISSTSVTLPGLITGTGSLTTSGTGTVTLSNAASAFDGPITIPGGRLESAALGGAGVINLGSAAVTGTFRYVGAGGSSSLLVNLAGSSGGGGTLDASGSGTVAFLGGVTGNAGTTLTLAGSNTGANYITSVTGSNVVKTGPGTWVFGTNSFTGRLTVEQGTIVAAINAPGGSGTSSSLGRQNGPTPVIGLVNGSGTAALLAANGVTISRTFEVAALGTGDQEVVLGGSGVGEATFDANAAFRLGRGVTLAADPGGNVRFLTPTANWDQQDGSADPAVAITIGTPTATGTVTLATTLPGSITAVTVRQGTLRLGEGGTVGALGTNSVLSGSAGATLAFNRSNTVTSGVDFASTIGGAMNVTQLGSGTVVLAGVNTYTGTTSIAAGAIRVSGSGRIADSARIDVGAAGRIVFNRSDDYGGAYDGKLAGSGFLTVQSGSLTLTGLNTFAGSSEVLSGAVLKLDGQINNTTLSVAGGATLMGSGTILGTTTIAGLHSPGSSPGIQTLGNLTYLSGASVQWELWNNTINNNVTPPDYDQILLTGNLGFSGPTTFNLLFTGSAGPTNYSEVAWGNSFWDLDREWLVYDVAGTTTGFGNLSLATTNWQDGSGVLFNTARPLASFRLEKKLTNDVYLVYTAIPEPGTLALAAIGIAAAWAVRRRAQRRGAQRPLG